MSSAIFSASSEDGVDHETVADEVEAAKSVSPRTHSSIEDCFITSSGIDEKLCEDEVSDSFED